MPQTPQRAIPSVDRLLRALAPSPLPRPVIVHAVRERLDQCRASGEIPDFPTLVAQLDATLASLARQRLQPVINGTGILIHTNLGRAPLPPAAAQALASIAAGYCNLEFDLDSGERGPRAAYVEHLLALASNAPAATVVNNAAAALVLILRHLTSPARPEVVISRGELVQIGGGFRIPDILESSGAVLREIGTTNQTTLDDYARAICPRTALVLRVHRSNFHMEGFVHSPSTPELAALVQTVQPAFHPHGLPLVEDLGSGALADLPDLPGLPPEPTPSQSLNNGVDLVCFSGDKLLGGPQAGIIAGQPERILALRKNPLFRALRCDKLTFAALQSTLELHLAPQPQTHPALPILQSLTTPVETLESRAHRIAESVQQQPLPHPPPSITVSHSIARVGGGVCPRSEIPSACLRILPRHMPVDELARRLRLHSPPLIACIDKQALLIDLRSVLPHQDPSVAQALASTLGAP